MSPITENKETGGLMLAHTENSSDVCATLLWEMSSRGIKSSEISNLVKDVYKLIEDGGSFTIDWINERLAERGWEYQIDEFCFELILSLFENELDYSVNSYTLH